MATTVSDERSQVSENWEQFLSVCDAINATVDGPKEAVKAIRKRLGCKQPSAILLTLKLLETCVKNCGNRFHVCVASKDLLQEMLKVLSPKYNPSSELQNTVLGLIQTWAYAFQSNPELKDVNKTYQELKAKGIEFPELEPEKASQILLSQKSSVPIVSSEIPLPRAGRSLSNTMSPSGQLSPSRLSQSPPFANRPAADRVVKLQLELEAVRQNCLVLGDLLTEIGNGQNTASDLELLEELNSTCRQMQTRIVELIESVNNEQITDELLSINDDLNNVFVRYDRYKRLQAGRESQSRTELFSPPSYEHSTQLHSPSQSQHTTPLQDLGVFVPTTQPAVNQRISGGVAVANLIDLDFGNASSSAVTEGIEEISLHRNNHQKPSFSSVAAANNEGILSDSERDLAEMERWLMTNPVQKEDEGVANFDEFLMQRATDGDRRPVVDGANNQFSM